MDWESVPCTSPEIAEHIRIISGDLINLINFVGAWGRGGSLIILSCSSGELTG